MDPEELDIRIPYEHALYVERETELQAAREWLAGSKRVLTVTALPATGKTWFLNRVREEFNENGVVCLWIDIRDLSLPPNPPMTGLRRLNPERVNEWLRSFIAELQQTCGNIPTFDPAAETSVLIETIGNEIVYNCWPGKTICVFVDEGDLLLEADWRKFELAILDSFARQESLRFVIALRDKQLVRSIPLLFSETPLRLEILAKDIHGEAPQGRQQIEALTKASPGVAEKVERILARLTGYDLTHPGLNTFLCLLVEANPELDGPDVLRGSDYLEMALYSLNPLAPDSPQEMIALLVGIADFADEWVIEEVADWLGVSSTKAWQRAQPLIDNWLVVNITKNRYKIADGVREFVRAALDIRTRVALKTTEPIPEEHLIFTLSSAIGVEPGDIRRVPEVKPERWLVTLEMGAEAANLLMKMYREKDWQLSQLEIAVITLQPSELHYLMDRHFDRNELRVLVHSLRIDYDNLSGDTKLLKIIELIKYCERHGRVDDLLRVCQQHKPSVSWEI
ncbi:MAG: hypothetical protein L0332_29810 [Chloroflexi bacterium]|nr:hypothetical protein [Chloroflexota bacterium]MCI0648066.1 hypothetical protein [Chloroflexota bacterium]MCI0730897.1 hypothetical protein [Chloroflexota bacterium]